MKIPLTDIRNKIPVSWDDDKERDEFLESLREQGQLHAIIVRPMNNSATPYDLVTGAKRYEAAKMLRWAELDAEVKSPSDVDAKVMRVHENLHRHNLPWYEAVILVQQLHELRQEQHGKKEGVGRPKKDEKVWGVRETASELSLSIGGVSEDLSLARAVQTDPTLKNIKDRKTAIKLVRAQARRMQSETMAAMGDIEVGLNEAYLGDSAEVLSHFPEETFDVCITDPPWLNFFDPTLTVDKRTLPVFQALYRVMKPDSFLFVIVSVDDFVYYGGYDYLDESGTKQHRRGALEKLGFHIAKTPVFWQKLNSLSRRGVRTWEYDRDFEFILVAAKGNPVLARKGNLTAFKPYPQVPPAHLIHPNEKPLDLITELLEDCSFIGSSVVDPFGGSGVTAHACIRTHRHYVIIERDKQFYDGIVKRLETAKAVKAAKEKTA